MKINLFEVVLLLLQRPILAGGVCTDSDVTVFGYSSVWGVLRAGQLLDESETGRGQDCEAPYHAGGHGTAGAGEGTT